MLLFLTLALPASALPDKPESVVRPMAPGRRVDVLTGDRYFGEHIAGIGDVNGDGFDDVAVGTSPRVGQGYYPHSEQVAIFYGSAEGIHTEPDQILTSPIEGEGGEPTLFGYALQGGGDINNDGFDDVVIAQPTEQVNLYVYTGGPDGLSQTPAFTISPAGRARRGRDVTAGASLRARGAAA